MIRVAMAAALLGLGGPLAALAVQENYAHMSGVYWFDGDYYQIDMTCWNVPGNPEQGLVREIKVVPAGLAAEAPEGWRCGPQGCIWWTNDWDYMVPPGEGLSGFKLTVDYDPGQTSYEYGIRMSYGFGGYGEFTPEYIPEPWLAGPLALALCGGWGVLRRRR